MGQHVEIFPKHIGDTDIIARFRVRQLRVAVLCVITEIAKKNPRTKMNEDRSKRTTFMIADLLSQPTSQLPPEVHSSDSATGSDAVVSDVIGDSIQSPAITSRGRIQHVEATNQNLGYDELARDVLLSATAETFPPSRASVVKPTAAVGYLQHQVTSRVTYSHGRMNHVAAGADPENCFGRGTLDLSRRRRRGGKVWGGVYPFPSRGGLGSVVGVQ